MTVAAAAGVPGVRNMMAAMEPPYMADKYRAASMASPESGASGKVMGKSNANAIVADRPGSAPTIIPIAAPRAIRKIFCSDSACCNPIKIKDVSIPVPTRCYIRRTMVKAVQAVSRTRQKIGRASCSEEEKDQGDADRE